MAGRGPAPKPANKRAGKAKDPHAQTVLEFRRAEAPELPGKGWHPQTCQWWAMWARSPQSATFTESDWSFLLDTALMHHAMWEKGQWTLAAEVRLRVAKFGATPEDRARLRMVFADADEKDEKRSSRPASSRDRYKGLSAVKSG